MTTETPRFVVKGQEIVRNAGQAASEYGGNLQTKLLGLTLSYSHSIECAGSCNPNLECNHTQNAGRIARTHFMRKHHAMMKDASCQRTVDAAEC